MVAGMLVQLPMWEHQVERSCSVRYSTPTHNTAIVSVRVAESARVASLLDGGGSFGADKPLASTGMEIVKSHNRDELDSVLL
jgi:hypothetical protein